MDTLTVAIAELNQHLPRVRLNTQSVGDNAYVVGQRFDCSCGSYVVSDAVSYGAHLRDEVSRAVADAATADTLPED